MAIKIVNNLFIQVSLTVDCGGSNLNEEEGSVLHELEETASPPDPAPSSPKKSAVKGIFSKWRSSSQEASVDKVEESQRLITTNEPTSSSNNNKVRESSIFGLLPLAALRAATSRESLQVGSGPNSQANSPTGSPSFLAKQVHNDKYKHEFILINCQMLCFKICLSSKIIDHGFNLQLNLTHIPDLLLKIYSEFTNPSLLTLFYYMFELLL